jgi:hypothetical protein
MPLPFFYLLLVIAAPLALRLVLNWIVFPIKQRNKHQVSITTNYEETSAESLTLEQRETIGEYVQQFTAEGFEVLANVTTNTVQGVSGLVVVMANPSRTEIAQLIFASVKLHRNQSVAIISQLSDGRFVTTGSSAKPNYMPRNPIVDSISFGWVSDVDALIEAHRRRLQQKGISESQLVRVTCTGIEWLTQHHNVSMDWFVKCGYWYRDEATDKLCKTWKGTFLSIWKLRQPVAKLRLILRDRRSRQEWKKLGMESWTPVEPEEVVQLVDAADSADENVQPSTVVPYRAELAGGEISIEKQNGTTLVRIGKISIRQYLTLRWATFLWLGIVGYMVLRWVPMLILIYQSPAFRSLLLPAVARSTLWVSLTIILYSIVTSLLSFYRGLIRTGGTSVVSVSASGLHFENAPSRNRSGSISRSQIQNLLVVRREIRFTQSVYQLEAVVRNHVRRQPLLVALRASTLNQAKEAISSALGISKPVAQPLPLPPNVPAMAGSDV